MLREGQERVRTQQPPRVQKQTGGRGGTVRNLSQRHRMERKRREIFQVTPQHWRNSDSRRPTGTGCTQMLETAFTGEYCPTGCGRGGGVTSRSCLPSAMTRREVRLGDALLWPSTTNCLGFGKDSGTRSGSLYPRR